MLGWLVVSDMSCWLNLVFLCLVFRCNSLHHHKLLVMELCGGDLSDLSSLELMKRDDHQFQVVDETEYSDEEIPDELGELDNFDDDDDDYYS